MKSFIHTILILFLFSVSCYSQTDAHHLHKGINNENIDKFYLKLENDADSISGFDNPAAWREARLYAQEEWQQKRFVAVLQRHYIDFKYGLRPAAAPSNPTVQAPCTNPGFETGTLAGWTALEGPNNNSQTMAGCCAAATSQAIIVGPGTDPNVPALPTVPPGGGSFACRLGQTGTGGVSYRLNQTFTVTPANSVFVYKYAVVLQDGGHACSDQPFFNIKFETCNNVVIPCAQYQVAQSGSACTSGDATFITSGAWSYKPWQTRSFDLTAYIGQCVNIEFTVGGCVASQGAHPGYCYIDASCQPMTLNLNGIDIPVGQTNSFICATGNNTLCAPPGFTGYNWTGPGVTGQTGQCVSANSTGSYSVSLLMQGTSCNSPVLYSNFSIVPKPIANFNFTTTPCQTTFTVPFQDNSSQNGGPSVTTFIWDWGDGTSAGSNPAETHTFTTAGSHQVELKISNGGCLDSITKTITITPKPTANFIFANGCLNTATNFTSTSTPSVSLVSQVWNWGDGTTGSGASTNHTYGTASTYTVKLVVTDAGLCKDSINKVITIFPKPTVTFTVSPVCMGTAATFTNTSTITPTSTIANWGWDFDNNGTTDNTTQSPTNNYAAAGTYTVELKATSNNGCSDSSTIVLKVNALPTATFTPANACVNANILLNNTSSVPLPDNISLYNWNFGAGATPGASSNQNPPSLVYNTSGIKTITLDITANTTCTATITKTVTVFPSPVSNFSATAVCQATQTAFTDLSTTGTGTINAWNWDFTSDGSVDNTTQNPTLVFPSSGTFTTSLQVTSSSGCSNTFTLPVNVWGHTIPNFSPNNVCYGTATTFTNLTNTTTNANVGTTPSYDWAFADGSPNANTTSPVHTYNLGANGNATYNVTLTATSSHNCIDFIVKPVNVYAIPTAAFTSNTVCLGSPSQMTDASNGNGNAINGYQWDFLSDGTVDVTGVSNPNYTFPAYGANAVSYTVSTTPVAGLTCSNANSTLTVYVDPSPVPDFTFVNKCINTQPNTFDGSVSTIAVGTNTNFAWAYGDGATGTGITTTHPYNTPASYNVTLTVTSNKGCVKAVVKAIDVYKKPIMNITNSAACDKTAMNFTAVEQPGSGTVTDWYWDFNNNISTIESTGSANASFVYPGAGNQSVGLITISNPGQCRDTLRVPVYVDYLPKALFGVDVPNGCPVHCVTFTDNTAAVTPPAQITDWKWVLGDGTVVHASSGTSQQHCYDNKTSNQLKYFDVKLIVTTDKGCSDSLLKTSFITVYPTPIASYVINPDPGNVVTPLEYFTNQSQDYTKWYWTFGDGPYKSDSVNVNPTHFYSDETADTYHTNLIVVNQYGCSDDYSLPIEITPEFTFYIPNAFTPANTDNVNDLFSGKGIGIEKYDMWIFDRWGEMIYYTNDLSKGWNGRRTGKSNEVQQDVYVWKVKIKDVLGKNHDYVGHVTLLR
ncbi:MAG: PKD domain-containing protein [Bacteroidota bacterium]